MQVDRNRSSINNAVGTDVSRIFKGKTSKQLAEMHKGILAKLKKGGSIDVSYWENVAAQVSGVVSRFKFSIIDYILH